jgi:hypothetical protein
MTAPLLVLMVKVKHMEDAAYQAEARSEPEPVYDDGP